MASDVYSLAKCVFEDETEYRKENKILNVSPITFEDTITNLERIDAIARRHAKLERENNGHNPYLYGRPLADIVGKIADAWHFDYEKKIIIAHGAKIHDIGKVKVKNEILNKNEELTDQEKKIIEEHPLTGEVLVRPFYHLGKLIRHHHEWYNGEGEGYPDHLKGDEIPFGSRIISVVDAFNAMTSDRTYRPRAFFKEEALEELIKNKGTQFDPQVVDVFVILVNEKKIRQ